MESFELKERGGGLIRLAGKIGIGLVEGTVAAAGQLGGELSRDAMGYTVEDRKQEDIIRRATRR